MKVAKTDRGFEYIEKDTYANNPRPARLIGQSSAIGNYADSFDKPGSSFLWFGDKHHLNREEVKDFVSHLKYWLKTGSLDKKQKSK